MTEFTLLTEKLNKLYKEGKEDYNLYVPIETLCDIPVRCCIYFGKYLKIHREQQFATQGIYLKIKSYISVAPDEFQAEFDEVLLYYKYYDLNTESDFTESIVEDLFKELPELVFDKFSGKFVLNKNSDNEFSFLKKYKNVKNSFTECCVCMEDTHTKTRCNHHCCYECMSKIKPTEVEDDEDDEDEYPKILCPICREIIAEHH
jgi:hypothetical protein